MAKKKKVPGEEFREDQENNVKSPGYGGVGAQDVTPENIDENFREDQENKQDDVPAGGADSGDVTPENIDKDFRE